MLNAPCPQCGAPLLFRSIGLPIIVCEYCRSTVVRSGDSLSRTGSSSGVPETITPLQLGTQGDDNGQAFTLVGRVRWLWGASPENGDIAQGCWTEWLMLYADSSFGWLAEAGGRLMLSRRITINGNNAILKAVARGERVAPGDRCKIDGVVYRVNDARWAVSAGCDGEIPFAAPPGERLFGVDLGTGDGRFLSMQRHGEQVEAYAGRLVSLRQLRPRGLRSLDGWQPPQWALADAPA
jgi:hypothetical protein